MPDYPLQRLFFDCTEADVLAIRDKAIALIKEGKTIMRFTAAGKEAEKAWALPPQQMLMEARAALRHIDPATYGRRVRKTYASFRRQYPYS